MKGPVAGTMLTHIEDVIMCEISQPDWTEPPQLRP
jgi:hypothetical protein